jgi:hypothetical protein
VLCRVQSCWEGGDEKVNGVAIFDQDSLKCILGKG